MNIKITMTWVSVSALLLLDYHEAHAQAISLDIEPGAQSITLVLRGTAPTGTFIIYRADTLEGLSAAPSVALETNTSLADGQRFSLATKSSIRQSFFRAAHWPGVLVEEMVPIPAGSFTMGTPPSEPARSGGEGPQTRVTISHPFWMGRHEVTQREYKKVMGNNPSLFIANENPVEKVSWSNAVDYCAALTTRESSAGRLPAGYVYRLPTEAEWEYACRAGTTSAFHYGPALRSGMAQFAGVYEYPPCGQPSYTYDCYNPSGTFSLTTSSVGSYAPNAWSLVDMHGNVAEWCLDWYEPELQGGSITDPTGPERGSKRVVRGGHWSRDGWGCRSGARSAEYPEYSAQIIGFRVVLARSLP
jgi:formylglycine-generating enzyme required for sulfatase activity